MAVFLCVERTILRSKVVLPVPAFPVKKTLLFVWFMMFSVNVAESKSWAWVLMFIT
jgi:hypothetical protein